MHRRDGGPGRHDQPYWTRTTDHHLVPDAQQRLAQVPPAGVAIQGHAVQVLVRAFTDGGGDLMDRHATCRLGAAVEARQADVLVVQAPGAHRIEATMSYLHPDGLDIFQGTTWTSEGERLERRLVQAANDDPAWHPLAQQDGDWMLYATTFYPDGTSVAQHVGVRYAVS